jgi:hypothetical protein
MSKLIEFIVEEAALVYSRLQLYVSCVGVILMIS